MALSKNRQQNAKIIEMMILKKTEIKVRINGQEDPFTSRLIKSAIASPQDPRSKTPEKRPVLIMENLFPDEGNNLIKSSPDIVVNSVFGEINVSFRTHYLGASADSSYFGLVVEFPEIIEFDDLRREDRIVQDIPDFIYAQFDLETPTGTKKQYKLDVIDCSRHGLGLLVTENETELLSILNPGDRIADITFFASWTMIKVNATVKHKSRIETGENTGRHVLGIESSDIIENCKQP